MPHERDNRAGFTLLEMLVAMALVTVIAGALYSSLFAAFKAQETAEAAIAPVRAGELAAALIRRDIETVLPPTGLLAAEFVGEDSAGDMGRPADVLVMHCASQVAREGEATCDVRRVELSCERLEDSDERTGAIVRRVTTRLLAAETPDPVEDVLCRNVLGFNLRYFDGASWLDSWDSTTQGDEIPPAVEVTLEMGSILEGGSTRVDYKVVRVLRVLTQGPSATQEGMTVQRGEGGGR